MFKKKILILLIVLITFSCTTYKLENQQKANQSWEFHNNQLVNKIESLKSVEITNSSIEYVIENNKSVQDSFGDMLSYLLDIFPDQKDELISDEDNFIITGAGSTVSSDFIKPVHKVQIFNNGKIKISGIMGQFYYSEETDDYNLVEVKKNFEELGVMPIYYYNVRSRSYRLYFHYKIIFKENRFKIILTSFYKLNKYNGELHKEGFPSDKMTLTKISYKITNYFGFINMLLDAYKQDESSDW